MNGMRVGRIVVVAGLVMTLAGCDLLFPRSQGGSATPAPSGPVPCGPGAPACAPPNGTIQLTVREPSGAPITSFSVKYDGPGEIGELSFQGSEGRDDIQLPTGPLTLTFSSAGHRDVVMRVSLGDGEVRSMTVVLPPAP